MTAADRELFRLTILQQIARASTMGLTLNSILPGCAMAGFRVHRDEVEEELTSVLIPEHYVTTASTGLGKANARYIATHQGLGYLAQHGLQ